MLIRQVSVFIENTEGSLASAAATLTAHGIQVICVSLAETKDYGLMRMIVSDPDKAFDALKSDGFSARITSVIAVKLPKHFESFRQIASAISANGLSIEYMYTLSSGKDNASCILKVADREAACKIIADLGIDTLTEEEAYQW